MRASKFVVPWQQSGLRPRGFTLVEVLAALVIVGLGMLGVISAVSQTARGDAYLRDKTFAHWVGMNRVTEMRLEPQPPKLGSDSGDVEFANRKWRWSMEVTQTDVESIRKIEVLVALTESAENTLASVTGFYGAAVEQPGATSGLWPGGADPGAAGGPQDPNAPKDPNAPQDPVPGGESPPKDPDPTQVPPPAPPEEPPPDPGSDPGSPQ